MRIKQNLILRHIGREYVIVEPNSEVVDMANVFTLNETAAWLWKQLESKSFSTEVVAEMLLKEYDIDADRAAGDAEQLVADMIENGLIEEE